MRATVQVRWLGVATGWNRGKRDGVLAGPAARDGAAAGPGSSTRGTGADTITGTHSSGLAGAIDPVAPAGPSDVELVERCADDPEAFGLLYDRYCERIYRYVQPRVRDRMIAEDVTADVFLKALLGLAGYRPSAGDFGAWLHGIAANAVIDHLRARRPTVNLDEQLDRRDAARPVEQQVIERVEADRVWRAVDGLSDAQRTAVVLRLERDLSIVEIADRMNRSEGAVRVLLHRAIAAIRERLAEPDQGRRRR